MKIVVVLKHGSISLSLPVNRCLLLLWRVHIDLTKKNGRKNTAQLPRQGNKVPGCLGTVWEAVHCFCCLVALKPSCQGHVSALVDSLAELPAARRRNCQVWKRAIADPSSASLQVNVAPADLCTQPQDKPKEWYPASLSKLLMPEKRAK